MTAVPRPATPESIASAGGSSSKWRARTAKIAWYANRLRGMGAAEIAHRLRERLKREADRRRAFAWADFDHGTGALPSLPFIAMNGSEMAELERQWSRTASEFRSGEIALLGQVWQSFKDPSDWHLDPLTGQHWPDDCFCFDVPFRHDRSIGDPKYVWERNRLQYLQPVAALAKVRGDESLEQACVDEIKSWIAANPPFDGLSWATGVEVALRTVSLLAVFSFLDADRLAPATREDFRKCLAAHGYWLARYPSEYSSANNHLIAECAALFVLGTSWPDMPHARDYASYGRKTLVREVERQILADGVGAEQSPTYTAFVLEWYLLAMWVAERAGEPFPQLVYDRLGVASEYMRWITDEAGTQPRIGDDDEGRVLSSGFREGDYVSSVLGCLSAWLNRPDIAPPEGQPRFRNLFFGCPEKGPTGLSGVRSFGDGGYTVVRREIRKRIALLVMDHGPLGYLSIAAHGHADALSLWLHIDGQPVLVDAGTFLYHGGGAWRDTFRGTPAHNTLSLDCANSSTISGPFNWSRKANARALPVACEEDRSCVAAGVHDGYARQYGINHERRINETDCGFKVQDRLAGTLSTPARVEIAYLLHPGLDVAIESDHVTVLRNGRPVLSLRGPGMEVRVCKGETDPRRGWYSPSFGERVPTNQIVFSADASCGADFVTEITLR